MRRHVTPLPSAAIAEVSRDFSSGDIREIRRKVIGIYDKVGFMTGVYVRLRFLLAPMIRTAQLVPPQGDIVDLGCGHGVFAHIVHVGQPNRRITGVDLDADRIRVAQKASQGTQLEFRCGNVDEFDVPAGSTVTITDVLHHMPFEEQELLLGRIAEKLVPGDSMLIKDLQKRPAWKYWLHYVQDTLSYRSHLYFRSAQEMTALIEGFGFSVRSFDLARGMPHPHVAYLCTKKPVGE